MYLQQGQPVGVPFRGGVVLIHPRTPALMREQGMFDPARLVFIDETCTTTAMVRLRGRAPRGERLVDYAPHGHWKTITFVGDLRQRGMTAPFVLEGAMNGPMFLASTVRHAPIRTKSRAAKYPYE
jgi:hypothetical protein